MIMRAPDKKARRTPIWKVALIPVLLIGLVWNVTRGTDVVPVLAAIAEPTESDVSKSNRVLSVTEVLQELQETRLAEKSRSPLQLTRIIEFDPFSRVGELAKKYGITDTPAHTVDIPIPISDIAPSPATPTDPVESAPATYVVTNPVKAVLNGPHGAVALIDSRIVRVGDYLEPNVRIVAIQSDAVVVELTNQAEDAL
jgi:hypothetical protein